MSSDAGGNPALPSDSRESSEPTEPPPGRSSRAEEDRKRAPTRVDPDLGDCRRAARGDSEAFERLMRRHQDSVYTRIFFMVRHRETAADLTQEAFLRAWKGLPKFRGESLFSTWLSRVATNVTRHHFERVGAKKRSGPEISIHASLADEDGRGFEIPDRTHLPEEWAMRNERQRRILAAVAELEPEYREALALRELHGYSYQEIGAELDLPIGTVKSKIFRARQALQEKLKDLL